jgi:hypothetical protein
VQVAADKKVLQRRGSAFHPVQDRANPGHRNQR